MSKARRVAVLLGTDRQYHRGVLQGVARFARLHGRWELESEPTHSDCQFRLSDLQHLDGVIMMVTDQQQFDQLRGLKLPFVDVSSHFPEEDLAHVSNDGTRISVLAIEHFIERGFHHFAFCDLDDTSFYRRRRFEEQIAARGLACHVFAVGVEQRDDWVQCRDRPRLEAWLEQLPKPIGILAHNDLRGRHVVDACRRLGIAMPSEVAVLGVDNDVPHCEMCSPPLSSIVTDAERIGYEAAALLEQLMNGEPPAMHRILIPPLGIVVRQSTDVTATTDTDVAKAVHFIRQHAIEGIDVGDVLRHVVISRTALDNRFLKVLGHTPHEEIRRVRLKSARELLAETNLTIEVIAERCGFRHGEYLGAVFVRALGQTPGEFRAQQRGHQSRAGQSRMPIELVELPRRLHKGVERRLPQRRRFKDLTGRKFKHRRVLGFAGYKGSFPAWLCKCKCGQLAVIRGTYLVNGTAGSCGCIVGLSPAAKKLKPLLTSITRRCYDRNDAAYRYYGGRGITVCRRWRDSLESFAADMGPRPSPKHIVARRNRNGHYTPSNCFWALRDDLPLESPRRITHDGKTLSLTGWARRLGISREAMRQRANRCEDRGLPLSMAITNPPKRGRPRR